MENTIHRRERITLTAIEIMSELGIQGLSTREIAKRQGISEGTLFKHFRSKKEIMLNVLEHYSKYDTDIIESIRLKELTYIDAVKFFINSYAEYYDNYPEITAIPQNYDVFASDPDLSEAVKNIYYMRHQFMVDMIEKAKRSGELPHITDSEQLTDIIMGLFNAVCLRWRFAKYSFSLKEQTMATLDMVIEAILRAREQN